MHFIADHKAQNSARFEAFNEVWSQRFDLTFFFTGIWIIADESTANTGVMAKSANAINTFILIAWFY